MDIHDNIHVHSANIKDRIKGKCLLLQITVDKSSNPQYLISVTAAGLKILQHNPQKKLNSC